MRGTFAVLALFALGCSCGDDELEVEGPTSYVRCLAQDEPEARSWSVGEVRLRSEGRTLRVESPAECRVFAGAGGGGWDAVREADACVLVILGDVPSAIPDVGAPVLLVPGGADRLAYRDAADGERVIDAAPYRWLVTESASIALLAGAPGGRYALADDACGFGEDDVDDFGDAPEGDRWMLSWAGPTSVRGLEGAVAGSALVDQAAEAAGASVVFHGWPRSATSEGSPRAVFVGPLGEPWTALRDGRRAAPRPTPIRAPDSP